MQLLADEAVNDRVHCGTRSFGYFAVKERYFGKLVLERSFNENY